MRLRRLALRDFRGVAERVVEFDDGVTVVVGDNETGKSSLLEAFDLLLNLPDDSKAARVKATQPAGRDVGTEVEAEFTLGELSLGYRKRWFKQRLTELRIESGGSTRTLTGREAHDEAVRLFGEHVDRTLWSALVVGQEDSLTMPAPGSVSTVLTALDAVSPEGDGEVDHGESVSLVDAVEREYLRYFTAGGKPTGEHAEIVRRRADAESAVADAERRCAEVEQDVTRAERLSENRGILAKRLAEQRGTVQAVRAEQLTAAELLDRVDRLRHDEELAAARSTAARGERERREALVADRDRRERTAAEATEAAQVAVEALRAAEAELNRRTTELAAIRERHTAARERVTRLDAHSSYLRDTADLAELDARLASVEAAEAEARAAGVVLDQNPVDDDAAEAVEVAHRELLAAKAALAAGAPKLDVRRLGEPVVEVDGSSRSEPEFEVLAERRTEIVVPDVLAISVHPGGGAAELAATQERAERAESDLLADLGLPDVAAVRQAARARDAAERALAGARETLQRRLDGWSVDELRQRRDVLASRVTAASSSDADEELPDTVEAAHDLLAEARAAESTVTAGLSDVEHAESLARKAFETASSATAEARVRAEQEVEHRDDLASALTTARAEQADEQLAETARTADIALERVRAELAEAEAAVTAAGAEQLTERLEHETAVRDRLAEQVDELHDELRLVEGRLEMAGAQGFATGLERARADLANVERQAGIVERRARAAERLRQTLARHRAEARRRYAAPLRERIETLGRLLHGPSFSVVLGEDLEVTDRSVGGTQLPVGALSTGAKEQLATLVRLAIAGLTAADGSGVPVVLDDALGWSDPGRLQAMAGLLDRVGGRTQVVLLTCMPDRYAHLPRAHYVRL